MGNLSVRKLDDETLSRLRIREAEHGVSIEGRSASERLGDLAVEIFGPKHGVDLQLPARTPHEPADLSE